MGHHKLREDKTCLNCGNEVHDRFCSYCGQENTETRHSFHYLFRHFLEDFVHYDGSFWKTVKTLLFKPGKLTNEYLKGKRASYVAPVKLYIFLLFIAVFVPGVISFFENQPPNEFIETSENESELAREINNSGVTYGLKDFKDVKSVAQLDSLQRVKPEGERLNRLEYKMIKKIVELKKNGTDKEFQEKAYDMISRNFSKVLFIYLPIFAFWLWLFHGKKRWYYFDHGIFTLHYFSFLLISNTIVAIFGFLLGLLGDNDFVDLTTMMFVLICGFYTFFYFFRAHSKVYGENKWISRLKGFCLFIINMFCILIVMTIYLIIILFNVH
ncbi:DUF3667 domain-containing protein [Moheibacter sediminis]|uniref:DUF3667 domain-containing protein n=1 Tax=Moheibacter sediminis TaxID=1434700 RepID=A0A1W2C7P6_9FLAO|nr:DUF3667 domain-containing protein [Moheibacter sediminis]SMC81297.1 Protein of unknown function [Moheibacter sediminis]